MAKKGVQMPMSVDKMPMNPKSMPKLTGINCPVVDKKKK